MKKIGKRWLFVVLGICILIGTAIPVALSQKARARAQEDEELTLFADIIEIKYREAGGKLQYRRWNETKGVWADEDWIDLTEGAGVPTPTQGAALTGTLGAPGFTNTPRPTPTNAPTPSPLPTATPRLTAMPIPTGMPEQKVGKADPTVDKVPVDAAHFSDEAFRAFLSANYDADGDGFLSRAERDNLIWLTWDYYDTLQWNSEKRGRGADAIVLDGLDWFPRLESIYLGDCYGVVYLKDHPSIRSLSVCEGGGDIFAENCENLTSVEYSYAYGVLFAKDCKNLTKFGGEDGGAKTAFLGSTPQLSYEWSELEEDLPAKDFIPVDEAHFGSAAFCEYLKKNFDLDGDGRLSNLERLAVEEISFLGKEDYLALGGGELKGLEYFQCLRTLCTDCVERISLKRSHLVNLCIVGGSTVKEVVAEDCPNLTTIVCHGFTGTLSVKNCVSLKNYWGPEKGTSFLYTPHLQKTSDAFDGRSVDADMFLDVSQYWLNCVPSGYSAEARTPLPYMVTEQPGSVILQHTKEPGIAWKNVKKDFLSITGDFPAAYFAKEPLKQIYSIRVNGNSRCLVTYADGGMESVEIPGLKPEHAANLYLLPRKIKGVMVYAYSPNRGVVFSAQVEYDLYSHGETGDVKLAGMKGSQVHYYGIDADGGLHMYSKKEDAMKEIIGSLPIVEEYFGGEAFCAYLKASFDEDGDGSLSWEELLSVKKIRFTSDSVELRPPVWATMEPGEVKGLNWFTNLEELTVGDATSLELKKHSTVKKLWLGNGDDTGAIGKIVIEDCHGLERIDCATYFEGELFVDNCSHLRSLVQPDEGGRLNATFAGWPDRFLAVGSGDYTMNRSVHVMLGGGAWKPDFFGTLEKEGSTLTLRMRKRTLQWNGVGEYIDLSGDFPLQYFTEQDYDGAYAFDVLENTQAPADGQQHYYCRVTYEKESVRKEAFSFTAKGQPKPEDFYVKMDEVRAMTVFAYSPQYALLHVAPEKLSLYYRSGDGDVCLGTLANACDRYLRIRLIERDYYDDWNNGLKLEVTAYSTEWEMWNASYLKQPY